MSDHFQLVYGINTSSILTVVLDAQKIFSSRRFFLSTHNINYVLVRNNCFLKTSLKYTFPTEKVNQTYPCTWQSVL